MNDHFSTEKEITRAFSYYDGSRGGIPVGDVHGRLLIQPEEGQTLVIGASGFGKTRTILEPAICSCMMAGESLIVVDPKGEIVRVLGNSIPKSADVHIINLKNLYRSARVNPLAVSAELWAKGDRESRETASRLITDLVIQLFPLSEKDPFWALSARDLTQGAIQLLLELAPTEQVNLSSVYNIISGSQKPAPGSSGIGSHRTTKLQKLLENAPNDSVAHQLLASYIGTADDTRGGILAEALAGINMYSRSEAARDTFSGDDLHLSSLDPCRQHIFFIVKPDDSTLYDNVTGNIMSCITSAFLRLADDCGGALPKRMNVFVDELFSTGDSLKETFPSLMSSARSRNIRVCGCCQSLHQLDDLFGPSRAKTILDTTALLIIFRHSDITSLKEVSEWVGSTEIRTGITMHHKPILSPSDIMSLRVREALVLYQGRIKFVTQLRDFSEVFPEVTGSYEIPLRKDASSVMNRLFQVDDYLNAPQIPPASLPFPRPPAIGENDPFASFIARSSETSNHDDDDDDDDKDTDDRPETGPKDFILQIVSVPSTRRAYITFELRRLLGGSLSEYIDKLANLPSSIMLDKEDARRASDIISRCGGRAFIIENESLF